MSILNYFSNDFTEFIEKNTSILDKINSACHQDKINFLSSVTLRKNLNNISLCNLDNLLEILNNFNLSDEIKNYFLDKFPNILIKQNNLITFNEEIKTNLINSFSFTEDQVNAINLIIKFLVNPDKRIFGLWGYAGTGKTTTISEIIGFLIKNNLAKKIALTAPTNKAVNIIKNKFKSYLETLYNNNFDDIISLLEKKDFMINFITIHRLLNYKNDLNSSGERVFVSSNETNIKDYEIIIIDETSMISQNIMLDILSNLNNINTKIIFCGDPCQLPPVNEDNNIIFDNSIINTIKKESVKYNIQRELDNLKTYTLKKVMRNNIDNVINFCYEIRQWINKEIKFPILKKYNGKNIYLYNKSNNKKPEDKVNTDWFKEAIVKFKQMEQNNLSNVILAWTNRQTMIYNTKMRIELLQNESKKDLSKYEVGDILMLNDFYNFEEKKNKEKDIVNNTRFYTSEQIKIVNIDKISKCMPDFSTEISKNLEKAKYMNHILPKLNKLILSLNNETDRKYRVLKLEVLKLLDNKVLNYSPETYYMYVIDPQDVGKLELDKDKGFNLISKFRKTILKDFSEHQTVIDKYLIKNLWRQYNKIFIDHIANISIATSISCHKSQASTYYNVFVDADDILNNPREDEAKRCLYTAFTRASNEIHILI